MMKMAKISVGWVVGLALCAGCFRNTVSTIELNVPAMKTAECARLVGAAVAQLGDGAIMDIRADTRNRKVFVDFNNVRLGRRNVEMAVRHAGFAVNDLPADEEARAKLAPACRGDE